MKPGLFLVLAKADGVDFGTLRTKDLLASAGHESLFESETEAVPLASLDDIVLGRARPPRVSGQRTADRRLLTRVGRSR